jgi:hypothetical protein
MDDAELLFRRDVHNGWRVIFHAVEKLVDKIVRFNRLTNSRCTADDNGDWRRGGCMSFIEVGLNNFPMVLVRVARKQRFVQFHSEIEICLWHGE